MSIDKKLYPQGFGLRVEKPSNGPLRDRFIFAPFSAWNTREEFWLNRRKAWKKLGIQSEIGRSKDLTYAGIVDMKAKYDAKADVPGGRHEAYSDSHLRKKIGMRMSGTSIFDPCICELAYTWWAGAPGVDAPKEHYSPIILDPFAGGSVRGIVASVLGCRYWGCELRAEQVEGNRNQLNEATTGRFPPKWICGDSLIELDKAPPADFIFSCPPYGNLEVYSQEPGDISNMSYEEFLVPYEQIIAKACAKLKEDRFACWVVSNYRDNAGCMRDFSGDSIRIFERHGLRFYNDIVLINSVGTGALRANTNFMRGHRKVVKLHQNILVFVKGDPSRAGSRLPLFWDKGYE